MTPKRQFVLCTGFQTLGVALLIGCFALNRFDVSSLGFFGCPLLLLSLLFSIHKPLDDVKWNLAVTVMFVLFACAGLFGILDAVWLDAHKAKSADEYPYWYWWLIDLFIVLTVPVCLWGIFKEYRAMRKILNEPPKV
ncbi:MAG: hypothetical protein WA117_14840 [Verrucomicrobiia bacterium]